jgi:hypothetical protein
MQQSQHWVVGQRVCREEDPEQVGTIIAVSRTDIKVVWDSGGISFYQLNNGHVPLKDATKPQ